MTYIKKYIPKYVKEPLKPVCDRINNTKNSDMWFIGITIGWVGIGIIYKKKENV